MNRQETETTISDKIRCDSNTKRQVEYDQQSKNGSQQRIKTRGRNEYQSVSRLGRHGLLTEVATAILGLVY